MRFLIAVAALVASASASANYKGWEFAGECDAFLIWGDRAAEAKAIRAEAQSKASLLGSAAEGYEAALAYEASRDYTHRFFRAYESNGGDPQNKAKVEIVDRNCFQYVPD